MTATFVDRSGYEEDPWDSSLEEKLEAESQQRAARVTVQAEVAKPIEDPKQLPHLLLGDLPETSEQIAAVMDRGPVLLADFWNVKVERIQPTLGVIAGESRGRFYRKKTNSLTGEPGKGKSLSAQMDVVDEAKAGRFAMYIDYEKDLEAFVQRVKDLGATAEDAAKILYWRPSKPLHNGVVQTVIQYIQLLDLDLIVIDSVSRAMSRAALDENLNKEVRAWYETGPELMMLAGGTTLQVDHTKRPEQHQGRQVVSSDRFAKGAAAKLEVITGLAAMVKTGTPFSASQAGHAVFTCAKDNNGAWTEGEVMCDMHVTPGEDGSIRLEYRKSVTQVKDETTGEVKFRPTALMERVCDALVTAGTPLSVSAIKDIVKGKGEYVGVAVERLWEEGFVDAPKVAVGKSRLVTLVSAFTEATDPKNPAAVKAAEPNPFEVF